MPSPFTSSFASAAAANSGHESGTNGRNNSSGDWSRPRTNGATTTFRRPSVATSLSHQRESSQNNTNPPPSAGAYVPPHLNSSYQSSFNRNGSSAETRYSKDQLLDIFRAQDSNGQSSTNISDLYVDGWSPEAVNGSSHGGWGRRDDKESAGPEICWDHEGSVLPLGLTEMTDEEREAFSTSVNSPLKPPTQNKDGTPNNATNNRRTSITQSQNMMNNSPLSRPGGKRRDSGDLLQSSNSLASPSNNNRFSNEDSNVSSPPSSLLRRKTDYKDDFGPSLDEKDKEGGRPGLMTASPFGSLRRTSTNPVGAGINGPSSPWSGAPQSAGFAPMGAFGNFGSNQTPTSDRKLGFGSVRGESRFKGLMGGEISEHVNPSMKEKASISSLEKLTEATGEEPQARWGAGRSAAGADREYGVANQYPAGSAALGGDEPSPPHPQSSRYRNPDRQTSYDEIGFSSLGPSTDMASIRDAMQRRDFVLQQTPQRNQSLALTHEPMSPTNTNPYQSPEGDKAVPQDIDTDDSDHHVQYPAQAQYQRGYQNQLDLTTGDRSQTSSTNATRGFPSLSGLGGLNGPWSAAPSAIGTPTRVQPLSGFGDTTFGTLGDINHLSQAGYGGANYPGGPSNVASASIRGGRLGSLFPNSQEHLRTEASRQDQNYEESPDAFQKTATANGSGFSAAPRDNDSNMQSARVRRDDLFSPSEDRGRNLQGMGLPFGAGEASQAPMSAAIQSPFSAAPSSNYFTTAQEQESSTISSQMPASQQRQMVMPDRMRWIYRDPQGNKQGPWSGLEMHDWYKAGFFSPELQVKKLEDADYEPLAQLIRRIGNSREPFLVPQIGIPHGSAAPLPSATTAAANAPATTPSTAQPASAQPPFANAFPSFGTTLTAEQQNALERRKQEEQYLMARQKEHLAAIQPVLQRQMQMQGGLHGQQLHHHSSAHSLQSQPSYGSITSPTGGYQPSPAAGLIQPASGGPGFFEGMQRNAGPLGADVLGSVLEEDMPGFMERLTMGRGSQLPYPYNQDGQPHPQQVQNMLQDRARLQREQEQSDNMQRGGDEARFTAERLEQYQQLRAQEEEQQSYPQGPIGGHVARQSGQQGQEYSYPDESQQRQDRTVPEQLSLSEQVQKAAAKQSPGMQPQSPWGKVDIGMPQPFPPPQSSSPMPAPTPQRNRQSVAEALNAESQSPSRTDSTETPSAAVAPWAKDNAEGSKGPSLKEIQATEARKAAHQEEIAAAARRAVAEQERQNQQNQPTVPPAPGLPSSANWASSVSPAVPVASETSPWAKPATGKPAVATPVTGAKKTLAQIQKEEEARKNRAAAAAAANAASTSSAASLAAGGKRYADLASKPTPQNMSNAAWTTVGAGGKVKPSVVPAPGLSARTASGGVVQPSSSTAKPKPAASIGGKVSLNQQSANDEFQKWTKNALSNKLSANIPVDDFVHALLLLPPETDIISDSIYASSQTLDGRRFAEEFVKRRKLADRGIIPESTNTGFSLSNANEPKSAGSGWSEVAKKGGAGGGAKEETNSAFKVVAGKKKGGKR